MPKARRNTSAYVVTVDMGYGHQRAAYPLQGIAAQPPDWDVEHPIISANSYPGIPRADRRRWDSGRTVYETISRLKHLPVLGSAAFGAMDAMQRIPPFYPRHAHLRPTLQLRQIYGLIRAGWGKHLIDLLNARPLPYVTSFFTTAFFAEEHGYRGDIYCICTDTDVSRAWAPLHPAKTKIRYLAPNRRVRERLKLYGVPEKNIFVTGFPLPKENIGSDDLEVLKRSLARRLRKLDPSRRFHKKYHHTLQYFLGGHLQRSRSTRPVTITFAVGGAGAQREIGAAILESLHDQIDAGNVRLYLVAGSRNDVYRYYDSVIQRLHLSKGHNGGGVHIIYDENKYGYFAQLNRALNDTDVLWTKPSELSFYAGLGLPIIMAPTIGSQERSNRDWLRTIGAGVDQEDPRYTHQWLFDWLESGWLAEAALHGFLDAPRNGASHIEEVVLTGKRSEIEDMHLL